MRILRGLLPLAVAAAWWLPGCTPPEQKCSQDRVGNLEACQTACEKGDMLSCFAAAHTFDERFERGAAGSDAEQAARFYEKACEGASSKPATTPFAASCSVRRATGPSCPLLTRLKMRPSDGGKSSPKPARSTIAAGAWKRRMRTWAKIARSPSS